MIKLVLFILVITFNILYSSTIYGISGYMRVPTASIGAGISYFSFNDISYIIFSKKMLLPNLEMSVKKHSETDQGIISFKLKIIPETLLTPGIAIGVLNTNDPDLEKSYFITMSKRIRLLKLRGTCGFIKEGNFKDAQFALENISSNNILSLLTSTKKQEEYIFLGIEKSIFGIVDLLGSYRSNGRIDTGIRLNLMGLNLEYMQLDLKDKENWKKNRIFMINIGYFF